MNENTHPVKFIANSIADVKQAENALGEMLCLAMNKDRREDFTAEEWGDFVDYFQQIMKLEHTLDKLKAGTRCWCEIANVE